MKRVFDACLAGIALIVTAPLMASIALTIRMTSPGPVLYRAPRVGRGGRRFEMLKFRTMAHGAPDIRNPDGSTYAGADDPRVTSLGRQLRKWSLDELPQLWNVVRGDMSLVGPRPELPDQVSYYTAEERRRLDVRPGLTGLAQVSGRNDLGWKERLQLDVQYVRSRNFALDLWILARTVPKVLGRRGVFGGGDHGAGRP